MSDEPISKEEKRINSIKLGIGLIIGIVIGLSVYWIFFN